MIRQASYQDLAEILEIYNEAVLTTTAVYDYQAHSLEERKFWYEKKCNKGLPVLVFEVEGHVGGFASYGPFRDWPGYKYTIEHSVYVHKEYRKQGIGIQLIQELIRIANRSGYATLVAGIDADNKVSIAMHEKIGFAFSGTIHKAGYKFGKWLDLSFYQYELQGPTNPTEK